MPGCRAEEVAKIEDQVWSQLDAVLTSSDQRRLARSNLKFHPRYRDTVQSAWLTSDLTNPSFLGFWGDPTYIDIWHVGNWYHWRAPFTGSGDVDFTAMARDSASGVPEAQSGPELPAELVRFWTPVAPETLPAEKTPPEKRQ